MLFKTVAIENDYQNRELHDNHENRVLRKFVDILEFVSQLTGHGELTITDYLRDNPSSLHHHGRALDIRVRDKSTAFYFGMVSIGLAFACLNRKFRIQPHLELYGKPDQHIHIEIRN